MATKKTKATVNKKTAAAMKEAKAKSSTPEKKSLLKRLLRK